MADYAHGYDHGHDYYYDYYQPCKWKFVRRLLTSPFTHFEGYLSLIGSIDHDDHNAYSNDLLIRLLIGSQTTTPASTKGTSTTATATSTTTTDVVSAACIS